MSGISLPGTGNRLAVAVDAATGRILTSFPIGGEVDGISLDNDGGAVVSCGDGTVHFARRNADKFIVSQIVRTPRGAPNSALDRRSGRVYVPTGKLMEGAAPMIGSHRGRDVFGLLVTGKLTTSHE